MSQLEYKDTSYYGRPITSLKKEELLEALLNLAQIINDCPVKGDCKKLFDVADIKAGN